MSTTFYSVDIEATGPDLRNDRIVQLAVLKVQGESIEAFDDLCYTDIEMNDAVTEVHGITNAMLEDAYWPDETDAFRELERGNVESNYFISHGNELDLRMLEHEGLEIVMRKIDTDKCSRFLIPDTPGYKLETLIDYCGLRERAERLAAKLGIEDLNAHDALSDALWHYVLFEYLRERVEGDLDRLVELTQTKMLLEKLPFGRHKGKSFEEVLQSDPEDLVWIYANSAPDWEDLHHTVLHWLEKKPYFYKKALREREENEKRLFF
ncbi:exonuclease domain-containing protein [Nitratifractor sp.]